MVDLLERVGHLGKAVALIQEIPSSDYFEVWSALLGACRKWGEVDVGRWAFEHAIQVDKSDASTDVLMSNIYAAVEMQEDAENIEAMRMKKVIVNLSMRLFSQKQFSTFNTGGVCLVHSRCRGCFLVNGGKARSPMIIAFWGGLCQLPVIRKYGSLFHSQNCARIENQSVNLTLKNSNILTKYYSSCARY